MRDFGERVWTPAGSRPHVYITPGPALVAVCDEVLGPSGPLTDWYPAWPDIARVVEPGSRHVTVAWTDLPTASTPPDSWEVLAATIGQQVAGIGPVTLTCDKLFATSHGVIVTMTRTPQFARLTEAVGHSMTEVFGTEVRIVTESDPHLAVFYGSGVADTPALSMPVGSVSETVSEVILVDVDTFGSGRWESAITRPIALDYRP